MATPGHVPTSLPPAGRRSPAYDAAYGAALIPVAVGASVAEEVETSKDGVDWRKLGAAIFTGVAVSVGTTLVLDWVKGKDLWADSGSLPTRLKQAFQEGKALLPQSLR